MRKSGFFPRLALVNLMRNGRFYGPYLLSCGMTAAMYYILSYLTFSDIVASVRGAGYLQSLMYLGRLVVTLFSAVLLLYANSFVMKRRRRELGLYNILGLEKRHTARLMVWETLYCAAAAIVGGLAAGVLLSKLVLLLLLQLSHLPVEYGFEISLSGMADTAALFGFLFLLTLVWNLFGLLRSRPVELLHSASAGEREPRTRRLLVVLGAVTLGGWLCHRSDGRGPLYRPGLFLPGGGAGDGRHLLPVHRRVHRPAEAPAEQPPVLLPAQALHRRGGAAVPDEAERRGPGQHLHPLHHGAGDGIHHRQPVRRAGGSFGADVSL